MTHSPLWVFAFLPALAVALVGCGGGESAVSSRDTSGSTRTFAMGLSSLPSDLTEESYADAFELAASVGEVILIRRSPPWDELLTAGPFPSDETAEATQRETRLADDYGLDVLVAIDATGVSEETGQLAGLPEEQRGAGFADEAVRKGFISYAQYIAVNWHPRYLALGVDVNRYYRQNPEDFEHFVSVYQEAYEAIKAQAPETLVFPTFQLEEMQGRLPLDGPHDPQWALIDRFAARMDLLAVSSYPGLVFADPSRLPDDYYAQLSKYTDRPIVIAETGYPSQLEGAARSQGNEERQSAFLRRVLSDAEELDMPLVVWFVGQDPTFTGGPAFDLVRHIGLLRQDGTEKPAWSVWSQTARRPLAEAAGQAGARGW